MSNKTLPDRIWKRPLDLLLVILLSLYTMTWLSFDIPTTLARPKSPQTQQFLAKTTPLWLNPPPFARFLLGLVAFVYGPLFPVTIYGLVRNRGWVKRITLPLGVALTITNTLIMSLELSAKTPPPNKKLYFALNGPYILVSLLLGYRSLRILEKNL